MKLTQSDIEEINSACPSPEQGVYKEPFGIPNKIKEHVIYMRWEIGEVTGGSYSDSHNPQYRAIDKPKPKFEVLDLVLEYLKPSITYLQYKEIEELIHTNSKKESHDCYGNCTDYGIEYIILSELEEKLK